MNKNYVKQFRLDNGIKFSGGIKLLNHKYSKHTWFVNDTEIYSAIECDNNLKLLTYTDDSDVVAGLLNGTIEFEKVKQYEQITFEEAIEMIRKKEKTYMKYNDELLICGFTFHSKHKKMRSIILSKNDNIFVTEKEISFFEALKYNFYKEV